MKNGHRFTSHAKPGESFLPEEKFSHAKAGYYGCLLCGAWTTYCLSAYDADEKMGPCPARLQPLTKDKE